MSKRKFILITASLILVSIVSFSFFPKKADQQTKNKVLSDLLRMSLEQAHFNLRTIDDDFSKNAFSQYLKNVDNGKVFMLQEDVDRLKAFEDKLDDELQSGKNAMVSVSMDILSKRIPQAKAICMEILNTPFDFSVSESYESDPDKRSFPKSEEEMKNAWRKSLKYQAIVRYNTSMAEQEKKKESTTEDGKNTDLKTPIQIEEEVRTQLKRTYNNVFDQLEKLDGDDRAAEYFNAMMAVVDPHTEYFPPEDKDNFDIRMSGKLEGIGAQLQQADGVIKVTNIVPGSASWKQQELKEEDVILKVGQGEEEPVDITSMPLKDAVQLIRGKKGSEVRLTVRKPDGIITVIPIIRDVVILEENFAKSAIINDGDKGVKYGYIKLPSFYADFSRSGGRNSAEDVKIELEKLKKAGAQGVILDLRFNGGGSLGDAIDMSGLFIKDGPIVQVKTKAAKTSVYEDEDSGITWDGPVVVLVNKFSASASEILAGALQDYGRAVVVGTPSTYGKGTVQRFIELDRYLRGDYDEYKPIGSLKLTIQKFYRITGKSTQWKGVESDIVLPDRYSFMDGEKDEEFALAWDEIESVPFKKWDEKLNIEKLRKKSMKRVGENEVFKMIEGDAQRLKVQREQSMLPLEFGAYKAEQERLLAEAKKFESKGKGHDGWNVMPMEAIVSNEAMAETRKALNDAWKKSIKIDEVIAEATNIIDDIK